MYRSILTAALLLSATAVRAETNVCTSIPSLPYVITSPGAYCLTQDLSIAAGVNPEWAIRIQAPDVVLDCNSHMISGTAPVPLPTPPINLGGIRLEGSARTTVRNCRVNGFQNAIRIGINQGTVPRPSDVRIEDNRIAGPGFGITGTAEGISYVQRNAILNTLGGALQVVARSGAMLVRDNYISGSGNTSTVDGNAAFFNTAGTNAFMSVEHNTFAEIVAPPGESQTAEAAIYITGGNVSFQENVLTAPSNPADKGYITLGIYVDPIASVNCEGNVFAGYGGQANNPGCLASNNRMY